MAIARPLGQHWTFGPPVRGAAPAAPGVGALTVPLAVLCLGVILFLIAATIILSLIPVYLPNRRPDANCDSAQFTTTFNLNGDTLPLGQLTENNQAAFQNALNANIHSQNRFRFCSIRILTATVSNCPVGRRYIIGSRKRRQQSILARKVRQSDNCVSQQITTTSVLNCGCRCVLNCLRDRVNQLQTVLLNTAIPVFFPDGAASTGVNGGNVVLTQTTTTTSTASSTPALPG